MFRVIADPDFAFERLSAELSGYYLLGFEPEASDRDGRDHSISVSVNRPDVAIRARPQFTFGAARQDHPAGGHRTAADAGGQGRTADAPHHLRLPGSGFAESPASRRDGDRSIRRRVGRDGAGVGDGEGRRRSRRHVLPAVDRRAGSVPTRTASGIRDAARRSRAVHAEGRGRGQGRAPRQPRAAGPRVHDADVALPRHRTPDWR